MKLLLLLLLLMSSTAFSFGQLDESLSANLSQEEGYSIEGVYIFEYYGVVHKVKLSTEESTFTEFDENGVELGKGKLQRTGTYFLVVPEIISTYSIINGQIEFDILSKTQSEIKVNLLLSDTSSEELELIKL